MTAEKFIKQAAADLGTPYLLGSYAQLNVLLDRMREADSYPLCVNIQTTEGSFTMAQGTYLQEARDNPRINVGFADRIPLDYDPETVEEQVESLKHLGKRLVAMINASGAFQPVPEVLYSVMFDEYDANLVVVMLDFELKAATGDCITEIE